MAIDPATAKVLISTAAKVVTDEDTRKKMIMLILAPAIGLLLLIAMIVQILTLPFAQLGSMFFGAELNYVNELRADTDFMQLIDQSEPDWQNGYGQSYEGVIFADGQTQVTYYNQLDSRWADVMYGNSGTIGQGGCGPTAMAMVISTFYGQAHDPVELAIWSVVNGHRCEGNGSYHSLIPASAQAYGLKVEGAGKNEAQKIADALASGKLVVAIMSKGHFTSGGHFIVLRGVTAGGKILVADPASKSRSEQEWDISIIMNEARQGAGAGGPFWIISR
jgi:hypothetical protein